MPRLECLLGRLCLVPAAKISPPAPVASNSSIYNLHDATGRFDFVLANPPFNVNAVDAANCGVRSPKCESRSVRQSTFDIRHSRRLWIQLFHSALNEKGRAGFVMANSASDARSSEQELRRGNIARHCERVSLN